MTTLKSDLALALAEGVDKEMMPQENRTDRSVAGRQVSLLRVFSVCLLAVALLFLGYELVERLWLRGANPKILHGLHLLRGISAAAIATALATIVFLRQTHDHSFPEPIEAALPLVEKSWKRRLQHVSLRTKIMVPMLALAVVPAMVIGIFTISQMQEALRQDAVQRLEFDTASKARTIQESLQAVQQDLRFLSQIKVIGDLVEAEAAKPSERVAVLRQEAEREFLIFSQGKRAYYQVRYLNSAGHEVVRLNIENGLPFIVPSHRLQDKSDRYYAKAAFALKPGQIYVSPMDLNVEYGKVEAPHRGVVRYATTVLGNEGRGRGLIVINIYSDYLFSLIRPLPPGTEAWVVDKGGSYLGFVGESEEKQNLYGLEKQRRLYADYTPEEVSVILNNPGQEPVEQVIKTVEDFVSFAPIAFDEGAPDRQWMLMIAYPGVPVEAPIRHLMVFLSVVTALLVAVSGIIGFLVAEYLARPVASLRRATRDIALGTLSKQVKITTGDEIEGLANDFNAMTEKLREAQERLSRWNEDLEREVSRQTDHLQRLQSGLARVDKLVSIGQMTAGIMHEIGNPLAAIKTKIQVAEEDSDLCQDCQALLSELIKEVDRLAAFLRSFSRLARLHEPQLEDVSLSHVVQGVIALVTPELRRRGISLHVESAMDVPLIRGDADQLRQLLINLILNAMEASQSGSEILVRLQCLDTNTNTNTDTDTDTDIDQTVESVRSAGRAKIVKVEVIDHGVGISSEIIDKIWDPFFTTKSEGTGLGLAICRQIAHDHGGTIQIRSQAGEGTVVTLTFPTFPTFPE